jgi:hypothetical protein
MRRSAANKLIVLQPALAGTGVVVRAKQWLLPSGKSLEITAEIERAGVP